MGGSQTRTSRKDEDGDKAAQPKNFLQQRPVVFGALAILVVAGISLAVWRPWDTAAPCGSGMTDISPGPSICAGLNLDSTQFRAGDPLADLEQKIAANNAAIAGRDFVTIVMLDDMTSNSRRDAVALQNVRHAVQGSLAAVWRANHQNVAAGSIPPVKLLLANFGSHGTQAMLAVREILRHRVAQHIVAVTGFGQSLDATRKAASVLSAGHIPSIGALVSGDNMNRDPDTGAYIPRFFRVTPTNSDAAKAAVHYLVSRRYSKVMLVADTNGADLYAGPLADSFRRTYSRQFPKGKLDVEAYQSPDTLNQVSRGQLMETRFSDMHNDICSAAPDLIYFAGRGTDLRSFLNALDQGGACGLPDLDVLTSDDANAIVGEPLPKFAGLRVNLLFTGVATANEWSKATPAEPDNEKNYEAFAAAFIDNDFGTERDLADGSAMTNHDAVLLAATAARKNGHAVAEPQTVADFLSEFTCRNPIPGAGGKLAFDNRTHGNPIDRPIPVVRIGQDGTPQLEDLTWAAGRPFDEVCR